MEVWEEYC